MTRVMIFLLLLLTAPVAGVGQRAFKPVREALKVKNYAEALNQVNAFRRDSLYRDNPKLCLYAIEANRGLNDAENMKAYLKTPYDTLAFITTTHSIITEALRFDSISRAKGDEPSRKQTENLCSLFRQYVPNIAGGARYYYLHRKYRDAMRYFRLSIDLPRTPIGQTARLSQRGDTIAAQLYLLSAYGAGDFAETHRYETLALAGLRQRPIILECLTRTAVAEGDTARQRVLLETAFAQYPQRPPFFTQLADLYTARGDYGSVLRIADNMASLDSASVSALDARCIALLNLARYDDCIAAARRVAAADTTRAEADYYAGASYVAKALAVTLPDNALSSGYRKAHAAQLDLYRKAEGYLERYRQRSPKQSKRWAPLLYKVYLALNEGKKFAEIEEILARE